MASLIAAHDCSASESLHSKEKDNDFTCNSPIGGWKACSFIIWFELIQSLAYFGILSTLIVYLTNELREGTAESAKHVNIWTGVMTVVSILSAFAADAYLGRYCTTALASIVYMLGLILLTLSVIVEPFKPSKCDFKSSICPEVTTIQIASFYISLFLISIGSGGLKTCLQAFGADQFDVTNLVEKRRKSSFFNWWVFSLSIGCLLAFSVVVYIQDTLGWGATFGIITITFGIAMIPFLVGTPLYRRNPPIGSPFTSVAQVLVASICNWNVKVPDNSTFLYDNFDKESLQRGGRKLMHTEDLGFLDKASVMVSRKQSQLITCEDLNAFLMVDDTKDREMGSFDAKAISPWKLCSVTQVEEVKIIARIIPIWISSIIFGMVSAQCTSFFTKQGITLDRQIFSSFILPAASLLSFTAVICVIMLPLYDLVIVPTARWLIGNEQGITPLQRMGAGLFLSIITMVISSLTEMKRLRTAQYYGLLNDPNVTIPMSVFWLLPQYMMIGVSDMFLVAGLQEFFYDEMPASMRSIAMALYVCAVGAGGFLSSLLITIVDTISGKYGGQSWFVNNLNRCHLDYFYLLIAVITTLTFFVYIRLACSFTYRRMR